MTWSNPDNHIFSLDRIALADIVTAAATAGAETALARAGMTETMISQNEAWRLYTRQMVTRWRQSGQISPVKRGNTYLYDRIRLEVLAKTNDL